MRKTIKQHQFTLLAAFCSFLFFSQQAIAQDDKIHSALEQFGHQTISSINACVLPSAKSKEVKQNKDGSFTARYIAVDPKSLRVSYKKPEASKAVQYIGFLDYTEIEYTCTGKNKPEALAAPCTEMKREPMRELVKHMKGKWTY